MLAYSFRALPHAFASAQFLIAMFPEVANDQLTDEGRDDEGRSRRKKLRLALAAVVPTPTASGEDLRDAINALRGQNDQKDQIIAQKDSIIADLTAQVLKSAAGAPKAREGEASAAAQGPPQSGDMTRSDERAYSKNTMDRVTQVAF